jgi:carboxyl-terminal processing protease
MRLGDKGAMKLTTARYFTPSGRSIQALGIEPDILVEERKIAGAEGEGEADRRLRSEADLRGSLSNELSDDERKQLEDERARHEATALLRQDDFQLAYALDLLAGLALYHRSGQ